MSRYLYIILFLILIGKLEIHAQSKYYIVKLAPFSSGINDEFSPVFFKGGIVFCSNQRNNSLVGFKDRHNGLYKIYYVSKKENSGWKHSKILAREISTDFNDGPATFNKRGNIMYYSRNNAIERTLKNISDSLNNLGIYSAELIDGMWTNIKPFTFNNPLYSFSTPSLTPGGERLYFSSDMPGGSGGMDLYYCNWHNNNWDQPVNLGPVINTAKNEAFPFAGEYGKLYFATDGHKGFGGKDLFYTQEIDGGWIAPVHLDSAINSTADDFGLVADSTFEKGYFSTNRGGTDDIFSFSTAPVEFTDCEVIRENKYCYVFDDEKHQYNDTFLLSYQWDFGDGIIRTGAEVQHCFPGPGKYTVKLSVWDELTGIALGVPHVYDVELNNIEQAYIHSNSVGIKDEPVYFDGASSKPKDFRITDLFWDFGDGFKPGGTSMSTTFKNKGEYTVRLGLLSAKDSLGMVQKTCVERKIRIYNSYQELELGGELIEDEVSEKSDSVAEQIKTMHIRFFYMDDLSARQKSKIKEALLASGKLTLRFDKYGILPDSYPFLDDVVALLKDNQDIRLDLILQETTGEKPGGTMVLSEKWAQELSLYFLNTNTNMDSFQSKSVVLPNPITNSHVPIGKTVDGVVEFLFMKN